MGSPDPYSAMAAYAGGWPVAMQVGGTVNATYCYGAVGVARDAAPDTGNSSELFAVIGATARRLDRNYALVGRVIDGMENLSALPRGTAEMGIYAKDQVATPITAVRIAADMPSADRPRFEYLRSESPAFADYVQLASHRADYGVPSPGAALCSVSVPVRKKKA
jgi:peptidylprolyl isomerase